MYGHLIQKCRKKMNQEPAVCQNCGKTAHGECNETSCCIHCGGDHPASSKSCSKFIFEKEVQAIKVMEKLTFKEARKKVQDRLIRPGELFSTTVRNTKPNLQQKTSVPSSSQENIVNNQNKPQCAENVEEQKGLKPPIKSTSTEEKSVKKKDDTKAGSTSSASDSLKSEGSKQPNAKTKNPNNKTNNKRIRSSDDKLTEQDENDYEQSSQKSDIIPRSTFRLKRSKNPKK